MSPLITTKASASAQGYGLFSPTAIAGGNYYSIATVTVGAGGASNISFSSIPNTYTHLQLRGILRDNRSTSGGNNVNIRVGNSGIDSGSNYASHLLYGDGSSASTSAQSSQTAGAFGISTSSSDGANIFGVQVIDILDYTNTSKNKTIRWLAGIDTNGAGQIRFSSTLWMSTSAITDIQFYDNAGASYVQYSSFALYGVK